MPAFSVRLQSSRFLMTVCVLLHVATIALTVCCFDGWTAWLAVLMLAASCGWAVQGLSQRRSSAVNTIDVDAYGRAALLSRQNSLMVDAQLQGDSRVGRWLVCLHWQSDAGSRWQVVLPDMTDAPSFRRLKVWARWCQEQPPASAVDNDNVMT